jgi:hypothetical protein
MKPTFNPNDPLDQIALSGARIISYCPKTNPSKLAELFEALVYPERFEINSNGEVVRKVINS